MTTPHGTARRNARGFQAIVPNEFFYVRRSAARNPHLYRSPAGNRSGLSSGRPHEMPEAVKTVREIAVSGLLRILHTRAGRIRFQFDIDGRTALAVAVALVRALR